MRSRGFCRICGYENNHVNHVIHWIEEFRINLRLFNRHDACFKTNQTQGTANGPGKLEDIVYAFSSKHTEFNRFFDFILDDASDEELVGILTFLKKYAQ